MGESPCPPPPPPPLPSALPRTPPSASENDKSSYLLSTVKLLIARIANRHLSIMGRAHCVAYSRLLLLLLRSPSAWDARPKTKLLNAVILIYEIPYKIYGNPRRRSPTLRGRACGVIVNIEKALFSLFYDYYGRSGLGMAPIPRPDGFPRRRRIFEYARITLIRSRLAKTWTKKRNTIRNSKV